MTPKTCSTCAHRVGSFDNGKCAVSGCYVEVERRYPTKCGLDFDKWAPRQGIFTRITQFFKGVKS